MWATRQIRIALPRCSSLTLSMLFGSPDGCPGAASTPKTSCRRLRFGPFKGIRGFSGGDPRAWTLTIVRNTSYSWLAKNRPSALVLTEDLDQVSRDRMDQSSEALERTPEAALIAKVEAEQIRKAMATLPVPFREVLVLREIHGLDYRAIAEIAELPIGTVMSRLARARRKLLEAVCGDAS